MDRVIDRANYFLVMPFVSILYKDFVFSCFWRHAGEIGSDRARRARNVARRL
jgi:hypothetical protein